MACASGPFPGVTSVLDRRTPSRVEPPCTVYVCTRLWITMHAHTFSIGITNGTEDSYRSQQESTPGVLYLSADSNLATEKEANFRFFSLFLSSLPSPSPLHSPPIPFPALRSSAAVSSSYSSFSSSWSRFAFLPFPSRRRRYRLLIRRACAVT